MSYQKVILQGNLTRDAEVRQVGQSTVTKFSVATSEKFRKADGSIKEETEYHDVELWDRPNLNPYLKKGTSVIVDGKIKTERWEDANGQTRERKKIRANSVNLCGSLNALAQQPQAMPQQPQYVPRPQQPVYPQAPAPAYAPQYQQAPAPQPSYQPQYQPAPAQMPQPYPQYAQEYTQQPQAAATQAPAPEDMPEDLFPNQGA